MDADYVAEKIFDNIVVGETTGCWVWQRATARGYGVLWLPDEKKVRSVHRLSYLVFKGDIPPGLGLDHEECDNPPCCNPDHLVPKGTWANVLRSSSPFAVKAKATSCDRGHEFTSSNTYLHPTRGTRNCRQCKRDRDNEYYRSRKVA